VRLHSHPGALAAEDRHHDPPEWTLLVDPRAAGGRITAHGELDLAVTPLLEALAGALDPEPGAAVVVDLSGVTFIDGSVVAFLVRLSDRVHATSASLTVVAEPGGGVRRTLEVCGADAVVAVVGTG
jgi:anti-anti-sigma factor